MLLVDKLNDVGNYEEAAAILEELITAAATATATTWSDDGVKVVSATKAKKMN